MMASTIVTDTYTSAILFGTELRSPDGATSSKPLTVFQVMVSRGQDQWVVLRPHSLFSALHNKLKDKFAYAVKRQSLHIPNGKKLRSAPSPVVISRVHRKLQRFLVGVFAEPQLRTSVELDQFLSAGKQPINEYMHILQPFLDTICQLGEPGEAPEPKTSPRGAVLSYATDKGMQGVAEGGLIGLDVRLSGYLVMNRKGQWRDRFFQLRGANALFKFASAKDSVPIKVYDLYGCKLSLAQGEDIEGAKASDHCFKLTWTKQREGKEAKKVTIIFATRSEEELGGWVSHLNNFALARADALVRKRIPDIPMLEAEAEGEKPDRKSISVIIRRKSHHQLHRQHHHTCEPKAAKESKSEVHKGHKKSATMNVVMMIDEHKRELKQKTTKKSSEGEDKPAKAGPLHKSADERDVYRVLKRSGSDYGAKLRVKVQTPARAQDAASSDDQTNSPNLATTAAASKRRHKRSSSMIDRKTMLIPTKTKVDGLHLNLKPVLDEREQQNHDEPEKAATMSPKEKSKESVASSPSLTMGSVKEAMARSKRSIGTFIQSRPIFSSHPSLPIGTPKAETTRMRSASHVVRLRPSAEAKENESIAFVNQLLDGLAEEDEAQITIESLQAEVIKFLTPAARNGLEPLCGHSHQLSFIAVNSIQNDEAKMRVIDALLASLPQANQSTILRLLAFLDHMAERLGQAQALKREQEANEASQRRAEEERHRVELKHAAALKHQAERERKRDMYRVLKRRPQDGRIVDQHLFLGPTSPTSSAEEFMSEAAYTSPSTSFSSLSSSLSSTCSCASMSPMSSFSSFDESASSTDSSALTSPSISTDSVSSAAASACGATVCYSALIERELAEERERIHQRKIQHDLFKSNGTATVSMQRSTNGNDDTSSIATMEETETDAHVKATIGVEEAILGAHARSERATAQAVGEAREKLALVFGRVIVACDRLPHVLAPMGASDQAAAVASVSAFLIENSGKWLRRQGLTEADKEKEKEKEGEEEEDEVASAQRKMKAEEEMEKRMEVRRARKMAMVALAKQKKETRMEEIRKQQQLEQPQKSKDEVEAKAYEDPRGRSELAVA